ncbi:2Fe-2S iron-sulfur cluster-binding protein, partial [Candidatus Pyrohabitans sp.]
MKHRVIFQPSGRRGEIEEGKTLREAAMELGVGIEQVCGGNRVCGKCRVQIQEGYFAKFDVHSSMDNLSPIAEEELKHLKDGEVENNYRLACAARVHGDVLVFVPEESRVGGQIVRKAAGEISIQLDPAVRKYYVELPRPSLEDPEGDYERLLRALKEQHGLGDLAIDYPALKALPLALRTGRWKVTVTVWQEREIIKVEPGYSELTLGIAFDIGTTTVVGYLTDIATGEVIAVDSMMNPQVSFGEDVMARITYAMEHSDGLRKMHEAIIGGINRIISSLCEKAGVGSDEILELVLVGNTAMHHIYLNIYPEYLGVSPFTPA